jgi:hypothetical protein
MVFGTRPVRKLEDFSVKSDPEARRNHLQQHRPRHALPCFSAVIDSHSSLLAFASEFLGIGFLGGIAGNSRFGKK